MLCVSYTDRPHDPAAYNKRAGPGGLLYFILSVGRPRRNFRFRLFDFLGIHLHVCVIDGIHVSLGSVWPRRASCFYVLYYMISTAARRARWYVG